MIPPINVSGIFTLASPFNTQVTPGTVYKCIAIREFPDILKKGEDPFVLYYHPNGLSEQDYTNDYNAGEAIVTLRSAGGQFIYVPTSRILSYPNQAGVRYTGIALAVRLGPIPDNLDLSVVVQKISDDVRDYFGITPQIQKVAYTESVNKSAADAATLEAARQAAITQTQTDHAKLIAAQATITAQAQQIVALQDWIKQHIPPP